jgi:hypothetical protein
MIKVMVRKGHPLEYLSLWVRLIEGRYVSFFISFTV